MLAFLLLTIVIMVFTLLVLFLQVFSCRVFARKIERNTYGSWWLILLLCSILLEVEVLGMFGILMWQTLLLLVVLFFGVSLFSLRKELIGKIRSFRWHPDVSHGAKWTHDVKTMVQSILAAAADSQRGLFILIFALLVVVVAFFYWLVPLTEIDSMAYHLPILYHLIATRGVVDVFHAGFVGPNTFFPAHSEALMAFLTLFTADLSLNFLVNLSGILLFCLAARDFGRARKMGLFTVSLPIFAILSVPFLFRQLLNFQVDLLMFGLFGSAVLFLFSALMRPRQELVSEENFGSGRKDLAKFFLVAGLMIGTKYNGIPQLMMFLPLFFLAWWRFRRHLKSIIWMPLLMLATGIFWYVRNFLIAGNPVYPFGVNIGFIRLDGYDRFVQDLANTSILDFIKRDGVIEVGKQILRHSYFVDSMGNYSALACLLAFVTLVFVISIFLAQKKYSSLQEKSWYLICTLAALYLLIAEMFYYVSSPYTYTLWHQAVRYSSAVFAMVPVMLILAMWYSKTMRIIVGVFSSLLFVVNLSTHSFLVNPDYQHLVREKLYSGTHGGDAEDDFLKKQLKWYKELMPLLKILREEKQSASERIDLVGMTPYWLFMKEGFEPYYVNIDGCTRCKYYDYRGSRIRDNPDQDKWKKALRDLQIHYLLIGTMDGANDHEMLEDQWAFSDATMFQSLHRTPGWSLYKVLD